MTIEQFKSIDNKVLWQAYNASKALLIPTSTANIVEVRIYPQLPMAFVVFNNNKTEKPRVYAYLVEEETASTMRSEDSWTDLLGTPGFSIGQYRRSHMGGAYTELEYETEEAVATPPASFLFVRNTWHAYDSDWLLDEDGTVLAFATWEALGMQKDLLEKLGVKPPVLVETIVDWTRLGLMGINVIRMYGDGGEAQTFQTG